MTSGVVSRLEVLQYSHSGRGLLALQVRQGSSAVGGDAARRGHAPGAACKGIDPQVVLKQPQVLCPAPLNHLYLPCTAVRLYRLTRR